MMNHSIALCALIVGACGSKDQPPASKTVDPLPTTKTVTVDGFKGGALIDLPIGYTLGKHESEDGEGDSVTATKDGVTLELIYTLGATTARDTKRGLEMSGPQTWTRDHADANGFELVSERAGKASITVYRTSAHGVCSANDVDPTRIDEVLAICKTLRGRGSEPR